MKTQKIFNNGLIFILALIIMLSTSCAKELIEDSPQPRISPHEQMDENTETYTILTEGSITIDLKCSIVFARTESSSALRQSESNRQAWPVAIAEIIKVLKKTGIPLFSLRDAAVCRRS